MSITGKELAKLLNISEAAISMALNNKPGVSTKTRNKILALAKENNYDFPNYISEVQPQSSKGTIHFIIFKKNGAIISDNSFFSLITEGINASCEKLHYYLNISYFYSNQNIDEQLENIVRQGCKGIILLGTELNKEDYIPFSKLSIPIVLLDSYFSDIVVDSISINNTRGAYLATNYLIHANGLHPGYLRSSYSIQNFYERKLGFHKALIAGGYSTSNTITHKVTPSFDGAYADILKLISKKEPLAKSYFADNDLIAAGAIKAFKESGYKIPEDISIIGFDDIPLCSYVEPNLSSVHVPKKYIGKTAMKRLVELITSDKLPPLRIEVETEIIERNSVMFMSY